MKHLSNDGDKIYSTLSSLHWRAIRSYLHIAATTFASDSNCHRAPKLGSYFIKLAELGQWPQSEAIRLACVQHIRDRLCKIGDIGGASSSCYCRCCISEPCSKPPSRRASRKSKGFALLVSKPARSAQELGIASKKLILFEAARGGPGKDKFCSVRVSSIFATMFFLGPGLAASCLSPFKFSKDLITRINLHFSYVHLHYCSCFLERQLSFNIVNDTAYQMMLALLGSPR